MAKSKVRKFGSALLWCLFVALTIGMVSAAYVVVNDASCSEVSEGFVGDPENYIALNESRETTQAFETNIFDGLGINESLTEVWPTLSGEMRFMTHKIYRVEDVDVIVFNDIKNGGRSPEIDSDKELIAVLGDVKHFGIEVYRSTRWSR